MRIHQLFALTSKPTCDIVLIVSQVNNRGMHNMNITCKAVMMKPWTITEDKIIHDESEYEISRIRAIEHIPPKRGKGNGSIHIVFHGSYQEIILSYPYTHISLAEEAVKHIYNKLNPDSNKEYRKKCRVCGHIMCYTDNDIEQNKANAKSASLGKTISGLNFLFGSSYHAYEQNKMADSSINKIVDYSRCPKCNSNDLVDISDEDASPKKEEKDIQSATEELKQLKELLDMDIITQEEFNTKKKQLLGL